MLFFADITRAAAGEEAVIKKEDTRDVRLSLGGDGIAYRMLVERHQGSVSAMMWRFSRDRNVHEELVQDVFVEAYMSLHGYKAIAPFENWLARIATRVGYRHWKKLSRERIGRAAVFANLPAVTEDPDTDCDPEDAARTLHLLLEQLPPRDRLAITLRFVEAHSIEETARLTGWSVAMVKVQTWRAKEKLKKIIQRTTLEEEL